jgi:hypothetical protein
MHSAALIALWHLLVDDPASCRHPLEIAGGDHTAVPQAVAVLDGPRENIRDRLNATMGVPREASQVIFRPFITEVVEEEKRVEVRRVTEAERATEVDTCSFERGFGLDEPLDGSYGHLDLRY